jgi:hypothetical protein
LFSVFSSQASIQYALETLKNKTSKMVVENGQIGQGGQGRRWDRDLRVAHPSMDRLDRLLGRGFQL